MDLLELNPALRQQPFELAQSNQDELTMGQRVMEHGRAAVSAVVEKLSAPFEALDTMPAINRRLALAGTIGAAIGGVAAYKAETASGHVPVDGAAARYSRVHSANTDTSKLATLGNSSSTGSAAKVVFYKQGDPRIGREFRKLVKKGNCPKPAEILSDTYASEKNPTGESPENRRKYGRSYFSFSTTADTQTLHIKPHIGYKPCVVEGVTIGYDIFFIPVSDLRKTKNGYLYDDPYELSDDSQRAMRAAYTRFVKS